MHHTPTLKLIPLCLALTSCTGLCAPTGTYELFPEDMSHGAPDLRAQDMRGSKDASLDAEMKSVDLGRADQGDMKQQDMECIPTTNSDDEDWLCDDIDNNCDGKKDENCCSSYNIESIFDLNSPIKNLKIKSKKSPINVQQNASEQWIITTQPIDADDASLTTIYQINSNPIQGRTNVLKSCPYSTITFAKKPNPEVANNRYIYHCDGNAPKALSLDLSPTHLYNEDAFETGEIISSPPIEDPRLLAISSPTQDPKYLWTTIITKNSTNNSIKINACKLNISKTISETQASSTNCTDLKTKTIPDFELTNYLHQTPYSEKKPVLHYTWIHQEGQGKIMYTSEYSNVIPPYLDLELYTHPAIMTNNAQNQDRIHIISASNPAEEDTMKNTLNLYTVNFGQSVTQAPVELLPRNNLNKWPAITEIDRDGIKGAEQVALVWQQDKRLMLAIFDPYNPGTITPKAITPEYPTATNIISSIASDDKGLGIAWTVEGETPQQIYYQAISFSGDFICPVAATN